MLREIRRIEPLRLANVLGAIYGVMFSFFALLILLTLLVVPVANPEALRNSWVLIVIYPVLGVFMGWLGGLVLAAVYNRVASRLGGIRVEVASEPATGA